MQISSLQLYILISYFLSVYGYKLILNFATSKVQAIAKALIPAVNLIFGLVLGFYGIADFDITVSVLGAMATGGAADLMSLPKEIKNKFSIYE